MKFLYCVRDVKANDVGDQVMVCRADAVAIRAFSDALSSTDPRSLMAKYPDDYELICIGAMSDEGVIQNDGEDDGFVRVVLAGSTWKAAQAKVNG